MNVNCGTHCPFRYITKCVSLYVFDKAHRQADSKKIATSLDWDDLDVLTMKPTMPL